MIFGRTVAIAGGIAVILCWPFASGQLAQKQIETYLSHFDDKNVKIEILSYERGYLSSTIQAKLTPTGRLQPQIQAYDLPSSMVIETELAHGFLSVSGNAQMVMTPEWRRSFESIWSQEASPFHAQYEISVFGHMDLTFRVDPFQTSKEGYQIDAGQLEITTTLDQDGYGISHAYLPSLMMRDEFDGKLKLTDLVFQFEGYQEQSLWIGQQSVDMKQAEFFDEEVSVLRLDSLSLMSQNRLNSFVRDDAEQIAAEATAAADVENISENVLEHSAKNQRMNSLNILKLDKFWLDSVGEYQSIHLALHAKNLDVLALNQFAKTYEGISSSQDNYQLLLPLSQLLSKGLQLELNPIQAGLPSGPLNGIIRIDLAESKMTRGLNPLMFMDQFQGAFDLNFPTVLMNDLPLMMGGMQNLWENFEKSGFIRNNADQTSIFIQIEDGQLISKSGERYPMTSIPYWLL